MKCPKCHYVSFDGQPRCRNCGYDFSLSPPADAGDLSMRRDSPSPSTLGDLSLDEPARAARGAEDAGTTTTGRTRLRWDDVPRVRPTDDPLDLPLFEPGNPPARTPGASSTPASPLPSASQIDDRPLISATLPPRPPLSVRRRTAEGTGTGPRPRVTPQSASTTSTYSTTSTATTGRVTPQSQPRYEEPRLELDFSDSPDATAEPDLSSLGTTTGTTTSTGARRSAARKTGASAAVDGVATDADAANDAASASEDADVYSDTAPLMSRLTGGVFDIAFMVFIDLIVLHFTFRLTGVPFGEWRRLPVAPLVGFLAMLHGGYLAMFTAASGQTMGKMIAKTKVVTMQGGAVPFGTAVVRAVVWLATVPTIVGLIPAFISNDHRALHDRFADTRVIKVE